MWIKLVLFIKRELTFRGVLTNAKCEKCESHEQPTTLTSIFLNSSMWSLNDTNSVGQTNVLEQNHKIN